MNDVTKSLVLALGVCYHACLKNREEFRREIVQEFRPPCLLPKGPDQMADIITRFGNLLFYLHPEVTICKIKTFKVHEYKSAFYMSH